MNLYKILRNRLRQRTNKKYSKWLADHKKFNGEDHHLLKSFLGGRKQNDYFQCEISKPTHETFTYKREPTEDEFLEMFIYSLENLMDYVEYLEDTISILEMRPKMKEFN